MVSQSVDIRLLSLAVCIFMMPSLHVRWSFLLGVRVLCFPFLLCVTIYPKCCNYGLGLRMVDVGRSIGKEDFGRRSCHPPAFDVGASRVLSVLTRLCGRRPCTPLKSATVAGGGFWPSVLPPSLLFLSLSSISPFIILTPLNPIKTQKKQLGHVSRPRHVSWPRR